MENYKKALLKPSVTSIKAYSAEPLTFVPFVRQPFDYQRFIDNLFTKLIANRGHRDLHSMLCALYRAKPECFVLNNEIHNTADGKETYISLKIYVTNDFSYNLHVYGIMRGRFNVSRTELYMKKDDTIEPYTCFFDRLETVVRASPVKIW
jgi:hypothetical protein